MIRKLREAQEREEGFTLIELLVVVIIIGILAAIAIPAFLNQRQNAWQAELTSDVRNTALDLESAMTTNNGTPAASAGANALPTGMTGVGTNTNYYYDVSGSSFCLAGQRTDTTQLPGVVVYQSGQGITSYNATGTLTCTP